MSPVLPSDLPALTATADLCTRFSQLINTRDLFSEFIGWLIGPDGELSDEALAGIADRVTPVGTILLYASASPPSDKYKMCNGAAVSRTTYSDLFSRIGTAYGVGDGSSTFNLPDFRDKFPIGQGGSYTLGGTGGSLSTVLGAAQMPDHFHGVGKSSSSNDATLMIRSWSKSSNGTTAGWFIPGDAGDLGDNSAFTSGDLATTVTIDAAGATPSAIPTLPPYLGAQFLIKVL